MYKIIGGDGKEYGPVTAEVLRQWIVEGRAASQTKVLAEGATDWKLLADLPEFRSVLAGPPVSGVAPAPIAAPPPSAPRTNSLAVTGLVLGGISLTFGLCCCSGLPFSVAAIVCSALALAQISKEPQQAGKGLAIAGLVLGIFGVIVGLALLGFGLALNTTPDLMRRIHRL